MISPLKTNCWNKIQRFEISHTKIKFSVSWKTINYLQNQLIIKTHRYLKKKKTIKYCFPENYLISLGEILWQRKPCNHYGLIFFLRQRWQGHNAKVTRLDIVLFVQFGNFWPIYVIELSVCGSSRYQFRLNRSWRNYSRYYFFTSNIWFWITRNFSENSNFILKLSFHCYTDRDMM